MNISKLHILFVLLFQVALLSAQDAPVFVSFTEKNGIWELTDSNPISILVDEDESDGVKNAVSHLQSDIEMVTDVKALSTHSSLSQNVKIVAGTYGKNQLINRMIDESE